MRDQMRADLTRAMKERDRARVTVLRSVLGAIENAEAVEGVSSSEGIVGYGDVARRSLEPAAVVAIVEGEIAEREEHVAGYASIGQTDRAEMLRVEVEILRGYVDG